MNIMTTGAEPGHPHTVTQDVVSHFEELLRSPLDTMVLPRNYFGHRWTPGFCPLAALIPETCRSRNMARARSG